MELDNLKEIPTLHAATEALSNITKLGRSLLYYGLRGDLQCKNPEAVAKFLLSLSHSYMARTRYPAVVIFLTRFKLDAMVSL